MINGDSAFIKELNKQYFWDVDFRNLDAVKSKRLIIERVLSLGSLNEINHVLDFYGSEETAKVIRNVNYLDPKTIHFFSLFFNIPKQEFKCCKKRSSKPTHLNF
jgi:hypothetical protein